MSRIPIIYIYLYLKIKEKGINVINKNNLNEVVKRVLTRVGTPTYLYLEVIEDLVYLNLVKRIDFKTYQLNKCDYCEKKIRKILSS